MNIQDFAKRVIPLNELPQWSKWPVRLLGLEEWNVPNRTVEKVKNEYDQDVYLRCLNFAKKQGDADPEAVRGHEFQLEEKKNLCVSQRGVLYELPYDQIIPADNALLIEVLSPFMALADTVVELGCGYGYNIWTLNKHFPDKRYMGGDYSKNAVELATMLYAGNPNISVEQFNFYDDAYPMLERCAPDAKVLVFSRHATEQLPTAANVVKTLAKYADRIIAGIHIEVGFENYGDSLLDLLRKRYVLANDYNRDLLGLVQAGQEREILRNDHDEYGVNPLNPSSIIAWKPR